MSIYKILHFIPLQGCGPISLQEIEEDIQRCLDDGFELAGPMIVFPNGSEYYNATYLQPIIKNE